jgi:hypothetical protein
MEWLKWLKKSLKIGLIVADVAIKNPEKQKALDKVSDIINPVLDELEDEPKPAPKKKK